MASFRWRIAPSLLAMAAILCGIDSKWADALPSALNLPTTSPATSPSSPIAASLEAAKAAHAKQVTAARDAYIAAINVRINAAEDAGNLAEVETFQAAKRQATTDGSLPDDLKDVTIRGAHAKMQRTVDASNLRLAAAYREAIVRYTKARQIPQAEAAQKELVESGLAANSLAEAGTAAGSIDLSAGFPSSFVATEPYEKVHGGIRMDTFIATRSADFLDKDFTFDVWFTPDRGNGAESVLIGIGSGNPEGRDPACISLEIKPPSDRGSQITINTAQWEGRQIGVQHEEGTHIARMQKRGNQVEFFVGVEVEGKFTPDASGAVADIRLLKPQFNNRNTHLYFGHRDSRGHDDGKVTFNKVRLSIGAAAPMPDAPAVPEGAPASLAAGLPNYLTADMPYSTNNDGIQIERPIKTTEADFLEKDFTFDVYFSCQKEDDAEAVMIGIGGTGDPDSDDGTCLSMVIDQSNQNLGTRVSINTSRWNDKIAGRLQGFGPFVARIEKKGNQVTFSVGAEVEGRFTADVSATVSDLHQLKPNFNSRNTYLFFGHRHTRGRGDGGVTFQRVKLVIAPGGQQK